MTMLNRDAAEAMVASRVSAATDVTGYGLAGHLLEMCDGAGIGAEVSVSSVPVLAGAREYLARGFTPAGTTRNVDTFRQRIDSSVPEAELTLMCDAQTSGGLLIAVSPERASVLEDKLRRGGLFYATVGRMTSRKGVLKLLP